MANLREIRSRINGVRSTSKITQAMKMVAAAKLRRAQDAIVAARPYAGNLNDLVRHLLARVDRTALPIMSTREETDKVLVIIVTADRGLCGAFNTNIIRHATHRIHNTYATQYEKGDVSLLCIGRRGFNHFGKRGYNVVGQHIGLINDATHADAASIMDGIIEQFLNHEFDVVEIIYNEFKSVIQQRVRDEQLLPLPAEDIEDAPDSAHHYLHLVDYIYEPSEVELMEYLIPKHLDFQLYRVFMESNAAEQGARMTAMDAATSNAKDLIHRLQLAYNRARQSSITTEILEIVSGANALQGG
ncbi:MAG: ATP synthase F1 subunit gamma [Bacteroidota bacterium]|jgi:F-type H+-transporting ATPase subunit gamma|nr:ATP synthase F1 subunit gamma [Bacteroidota bacterium]